MAKKIKSDFDYEGNIKSFSHEKKKLNLNDFKEYEIDSSKQNLVSYSQYQIYSQCPYKWSQQYIYKTFKTPPSIHLIFGTAIHEIFQEYLKNGYNISFAFADRMDLESVFLSKLKNEYSKGRVIDKN